MQASMTAMEQQQHAGIIKTTVSSCILVMLRLVTAGGLVDSMSDAGVHVCWTGAQVDDCMMLCTRQATQSVKLACCQQQH
jgi:hypothetical protein